MADRIRRCTLAAIALPVLFLAMSGMANAATLTVNNTNDTGMGSLRGQILGASSGDTINFNVSGTITLGSTLPAIAINLTIDGSGQSITVDGANSFQIFSVNSGATLTLRNLTIAHGNEQSIPEGEQGGGVENKGTLFVTNCTFSDNSAGLGGGGITNDPDATLTVTNSTLSGNNAPSGGGINNFGTLTVTNSTFSGNNADKGGGILNNEGATLKVTNSTFSSNSTGFGSGGAILTADSTTSLKGTIMAANTGGNCGNILTPVTDDGYNISDDGSCGFTMAPGRTSINNSTTLNLDPAGLQNHGGPTKTIALEPNSQAVDFIPVASCTDQLAIPQPLTTDQRGLPRPDPGNPNFCDAGAFELTTMPFAIAPNSERLQIARSTNHSDQINTAFTFIENGFPTCDAGTDAFNGFLVVFESGTCAVHDHASLAFFLHPWIVHTINRESYGTVFSSFPPGSLSARMVELPTPAPPACGEWTLNLEIAGIDSTPLGDGPFSLILFNGDGGQQCFDITNAIVGNQIPTPGHGVRRRVRRR